MSTTSRRHEYLEALKARLDQWNQQIDDLERELASAKAEREADLRSQLERIHGCRDELKARLTQARQSGEAGWEELHRGMESAGHELGDALARAMERFQGK
jgi:predicted  nucleic acid-binding Zn-ribbon protein